MTRFRLFVPLMTAAILTTPCALAQAPADPHAGHAPPTSDPHAGHAAPPANHGQHAGHAGMTGMAGMAGALGGHPMSRESSGTSWQPDAARHSGMHHGGLHHGAGDWTIMSHVDLQAVYSSQGGPRGDDKGFLAGMAMASARRDLDNGDTLQFRAMLSPDPFMGKSGYPLLLAAGETADGIEPLIDRQHPHDLFMELSASYAKRLSDKDTLFVYGGLPGEPAFGPPAFMHRPAAIMSPEAPITHHWLDSTHITYGVVTIGWAHDTFKIEASRFRGRESDQDRFDIETGKLDSTAVRVSWNPTANWALQASWADQISPEQLEPDEDSTKWSASALYTRRWSGLGEVSFTGAFARKDGHDGAVLDVWLGEASLAPNARWTLFARAEAVETDELGPHHGPVEDVAKASIGFVRDFALTPSVKIGLGALASYNWVSDALAPLYDGDQPGAMAFVRFKVG
jgi:hypothetical protein